jgi:acyl carrier protein
VTIEDVIQRVTGQQVDSATAIETLNVDSLEFLDLLLLIENETGKRIPDGRMALLTTVGDISRESV